MLISNITGVIELSSFNFQQCEFPFKTAIPDWNWHSLSIYLLIVKLAYDGKET